jgi:hypothetical protein
MNLTPFLALRPAYEKLSAQLTAANPQTQTVGFWLAAAELERDRPDQAAGIIDHLDAAALESASADEKWTLRLDALRGLLLDAQGDHAAALPLLQSAADCAALGTAASSRFLVAARRSLTPGSDGTCSLP